MIARFALVASLLVGASGCTPSYGDAPSRPDDRGTESDRPNADGDETTSPTTERAAQAETAEETAGVEEKAVAGSFTGRWLSRAARGGELHVELTGNDTLLTGTVAFEGSPCFTGGTFTGAVSLEGTMRGRVRAGEADIAVDLTVSDESIAGTYEVIQGGACTGDTGTLSARP